MCYSRRTSNEMCRLYRYINIQKSESSVLNAHRNDFGFSKNTSLLISNHNAEVNCARTDTRLWGIQSLKNNPSITNF